MIAGELSWLGENWARLIVAGSSLGTLTFAWRIYSIWRRGRTDDKKIDVDGDTAIRAHYAEELKSLREQITKSGDAHAERARAAEERYQRGLRAADERHDAAMVAADEREAACQEQVRQLREDVRELSAEVVGLRAQLLQTGRSAIVLATHAPNEGIAQAAERAAAAIGETEQRVASIPHHREPEE